MHRFSGAKNVLTDNGTVILSPNVPSNPRTASNRPGSRGNANGLRPGTTGGLRPGTRGNQFGVLPADQRLGSYLQHPVLSARGESGAAHVQKLAARSPPQPWADASAGGGPQERANRLLQMADILYKLGEEQKRQQDVLLPDERIKSFCNELLDIVDNWAGEGGQNAKSRKLHGAQENFYLRRELAERDAKVAAHENTFFVYMSEREKGRRRNAFCREFALKARFELHENTCLARVFGAWQTASAKRRYDEKVSIIAWKLRADGFAAKAETMMRLLAQKDAAGLAQCFSAWTAANVASKEQEMAAWLGTVQQQAELMKIARVRALRMLNKTICGSWRQVAHACFAGWIDKTASEQKRRMDESAEAEKRELRREIITARVMRSIGGGEQVVRAMMMVAWQQLTETNKDLGIERQRLRRMADIGRTVVIRLRRRNLIKLSFVRWYGRANG